jgi:uncharacterized membrane protein
MKKSVVIIAFLALFLLTLISAGFAQENATEQQGLEKQVQIPENMQGLARVLFGIKPDTTIDFQHLIILFAAFLIVFLVVRDFIGFIPFFDSKLKSILGAFAVTIISGSAGGFIMFADFMLSIGSLFGWLKTQSILNLTIALIIFVSLYLVLNKVSENMKSEAKIEEARQAGEKAGTVAKILGKMFETKGKK